jgi:autotransporter-associated beta strand protein
MISAFAWTFRRSFCLCLLLIEIQYSGSAHGDSRYFSYLAGERTTWDNAATPDWATSSGGSYNQLWTAGSDAHFEGVGGTVTVSDIIDNFNSITFDVNGYTLNEGTLTFTGSPTWLTTNTGRATIGSVVSGTGCLYKYGTGMLELTGANTISGGISVSRGMLRLSSPLALPGGTGLTGGSCLLELYNDYDMSYGKTPYDGVVELASGNFYRALGTGAENVWFLGGGGFSAVGADRVVNLGGASTQVKMGASYFVRTGNAFILGSPTSDAMVDFQNPIDLGNQYTNCYFRIGNGSAPIDARLSGVLSGTEMLQVQGPGTLELTAADTYTGSTYLQSGVLRLSNPLALPGGTGLTGGLSNLVLGAYQYGLEAPAVLELAAGDFFRSVGNGSSQVQFGTSSSLGAGFSAAGADRIVNLGGNSMQVVWGSNFVRTGYAFVLGSPSDDAMLDFQNPIDLGNAMRTVRVDHGAATVDGKLSGVLSGAGGGITKTGAGILLLTASNIYTGNTVVSSGTLVLADIGSLSLDVNNTTNSLITVASDARLDLFGTIRLDISDVTVSSGSWILINNSGTNIYEPSFSLAILDSGSFTQINDIWSYTTGPQQWTFTESTGVLSLVTVPEPPTLTLLGIVIFSLIGRLWYKRGL